MDWGVRTIHELAPDTITLGEVIGDDPRLPSLSCDYLAKQMWVGLIVSLVMSLVISLIFTPRFLAKCHCTGRGQNRLEFQLSMILFLSHVPSQPPSLSSPLIGEHACLVVPF